MENICRYRWCAMLWRSSVFLREIKTILQAQGRVRVLPASTRATQFHNTRRPAR